jgi:pimeloyl-ACP methyl ester carboxylesterase
LDKIGTLPKDMVRIPGTSEFSSFFIDKYEVTNIQFKEFVENGGYRDKKYWKHAFIKNGKEVTWEEAMTKFQDMTNRLGPSTWEGGTYPKGEDDYPVSGVSWYEAAAYAEFAGKSLPTIRHWGADNEAETLKWVHHLIFPMSNFGEGGPVAVGTTQAITPFGLYDMAGNVREWCWNESELGRCIRGGAWNDATYMFGNITQADPFNRSPKNGFRCVIYPEREKVSESLFKPHDSIEPRNYYKETPVSDAIYSVYKDMFSYDQTDLMVSEEGTDESSPDWVYQKVSISAAYDNERMTIHLFLPKNTSSPYQTVIYYPGAGSALTPSSEDLENYWEFTNNLSFIVRSRRAVIYPVYFGTFERMVSSPDWLNDFWFRDFIIKQVKDFKQIIDYLETRSDIDAKRLAYFGFSDGVMANIIPAIEERIQLSIHDVGGLEDIKTRPDIDPFNYVSRITIPTLMLNGKFDMAFPYETSSKPMFDLLGTPNKDKRQKIYDTDHFIPRRELIKEILAWLDQYFGPVK